MKKNNKETVEFAKPHYEPYVSIDKNIFTALSMPAFSLYMVFRFEAEFNRENTEIKQTAESLYKKAKIGKTQYYECMNELEDQGLVIRDPKSQLGDKCIFHVSNQLGYFSLGVRNTDTGVRHTDTYHYLSNINITNSDNLKKNEKTNKENKLIEEVKEVYHKELPELPKVRTMDTKFKQQLKKMIRNWPNYNEGKEFTIESFTKFLRSIKAKYPWFLRPYKTESGNSVKCSLRKITRETNITKFVNGEFSCENY